MSQDAASLPELTRRQEQILSLIIRSYTHKPEPVSSKLLAETQQLSVSSATIRNEMAVLEELGYIAAPHTSAGRVPTENGYRYFVARLIHDGELSENEQTHIAERFQALPMATEQWMRYAATALARTAHTASLVTPPTAQTGRFKHVELIAIQGRLVLMVLVLQGGTVQQRMLNLAEPLMQKTLSDAAERINGLCQDLTANEMLLKAVSLPLLEREVVELAAEVIEQAQSRVRMVYREGLSDVINSFSGGEGAQQAVRVFEERAFLNVILDEFLGPVLPNDVHVVIAGDGRREELSQISMVLSRYGVPGQMTGALGLLGPTHINYGRAISTVRYVSSMMTNMLVDLYNNGDSSDDDPDHQVPGNFVTPVDPKDDLTE